jgi:glucokinase
LGDVGGTNVRLKLIQVTPGFEEPTKEYKNDKLKVADHKTFESAIEEFLRDAPVRPRVAVIAIAGPVKENVVRMSNVEKWGDLVGKHLALALRFDHFVFLNDFEAAAYGASVLKEEEVIHINHNPLQETKVKAVVGAGTGLGTAMLFPAPFRNRFRSYVIPGEGGHVNFAPANVLET